MLLMLVLLGVVEEPADEGAKEDERKALQKNCEELIRAICELILPFLSHWTDSSVKGGCYSNKKAD